MEINYVDGVRNGEDNMYHGNGQIAVNHFYKNGQIVDGTYVDLDSNGEKMGVFIYKNGKLNGKAFTYYENGQLRSEGNWENEERHGYWKEYYESGQLRSEGNWKNEERHGYWKEYYESGQLKSERNYKDGYRLLSKCWEEDGNEIGCGNGPY